MRAFQIPGMEAELEARIEEMGFELVEASWAGSLKRPVLRIRIDVPDSVPGQGVTVDQCALVSRALEAWLDAEPEIPERYVLEVSSPGVDRPLVRPRDWKRFTGEHVVIKGEGLAADGGNRIEGLLVGLAEDDPSGAIALVRLLDGAEVRVPLGRVKRANLLYRWD